jgi:hypothetical protein
VRLRSYVENPDLAAAVKWKEGEPVKLVGADRLDPGRIDLGAHPELYNVDAVAYESVMLGLFSIWRGQPDHEVRDKPNEVTVGFNRDGFHWMRPYWTALIPVSEQPEAWNHSNVQSVGGVCLVVGDGARLVSEKRGPALDVVDGEIERLILCGRKRRNCPARRSTFPAPRQPWSATWKPENAVHALAVASFPGNAQISGSGIIAGRGF